MTAHSDRWGPFVEGLTAAERRNRLRALDYLVRLYSGPSESELTQLLIVAEMDATALGPAWAALNRLPLATRKAILDAYALIPA